MVGAEEVVAGPRTSRVRLQGHVQRWWLVLVAVAVLGMAMWLRTISVPYLALTSLATMLALAAAVAARSGRWALVGVAILAGASVIASVYQRRVALVDGSWPTYSRDLDSSGVTALQVAAGNETNTLYRIAAEALRASDDPQQAFPQLEALLGSSPAYRGVVLLGDTSRIAWAGNIRVPVEDVTTAVTVRMTTFYVALVVMAQTPGRVAMATSLLHAVPPANRLSRSLDDAVVGSRELAGFEYQPAGMADSGWSVLRAGTRELALIRPIPLSQGETRVHVVERARRAVGAGLLIALLVLSAVAWWRPASLSRRLLVLGVLLAITAIIPFNAFSNLSRIFDPAVYYASLGGPLTGSVGALAVTAAILLLGCLAFVRSRIRRRSRLLAAMAIVLAAALGPFVLRDLARGVTLPPQGAPPTLWLAWQIALFLSASALLLIGAGAGRLALGTGRGLPPILAPIIASIAAIIGMPIWESPGRWPGWYPALWVAAIAALALARRSRRLVLSAGVVAACGATTLLWGSVSRKRVELAQHDVAQLSRPDSASVELLDRFGATLEEESPPLERSDLLLRYVQSPLAAAGNAVGLATWLPGEDEPHAELFIASFEHHPESERRVVGDARARGVRSWDLDNSTQGVQTLMAVPYPDGSVTTVIVAPRTALIPEDPFTSLIGLAPPNTTEPLYDLTLTTLPSPVRLSDAPEWLRKDDALHGDWRVPGAAPNARVHLEVDLRGLDVLLPRGALIVLLDLVLLGGLWGVVASADGGLGRWMRSRVTLWARSYRGRLTVTLFAFFVIPAATFALWSYRRLQHTDRDSRALLVRETLRSITAGGEVDRLDTLSDRFDTPLFEYQAGVLRDESDRLYNQLAPTGRYLPASVAIDLGVQSEVTSSARPQVAGVPMLFGYRTVERETGGRAVLAAPAPVNERGLDRERRDIGTLVAFVTSLGALAALWLSGLAARELERPVGALRRAALRIARGERYPGPEARPAAEFVPVFSAFERMDTDLAASRAALEAAERRTAAVLRDVASGVIAIDRGGAVTLANPRAEAILGRALPPGTSLRDFGDSFPVDRTKRFLSSDVETEVFDLDLGGRQLRAALTRLASGTGGAVLTLDDVTDLARAERVLAWGEMARQVAHEIKNPLTPIRLGVQHLRRARRDPRVDFDQVFEQNVMRILSEIDRLDEIARAFSRYGVAGSDAHAPEPVDVAAVAQDVVELERMGVSEIRWHVRGADDPVRALARSAELRDVLLNVLENARQAHAFDVTVAVERRDGRVELVVVDNGDGITLENQARVFEPRFSTRTSGSGLGLAISRGLVRSWGGDMQVTPAQPRGTEMRIVMIAAE